MNAIIPPAVADVAALRTRLWQDGGFRPLALLTNGKRPKGAAWQDRARRDPPEAAAAPPATDALNTGILCDGLRVLDLDCDDTAVVTRLRGLAVAMLGEAPMRWRENSPRVALLYRAAEGEPDKRILSGTSGKVEVLGRGQQVLAFGLHPSGAPLRWSPMAPGDVAVGDLPAVTEGAVDAFLTAAAGIVGAEVKPPAASASAHAGQSSPLGLAADPAEVASALAAIPNNGPPDWENWNRVGMAAWCATGGTAEGFDAWCAWSAKHPAHDGAQARERWQHFAASPPDAVGAGTLFRLAQMAGWRRPEPWVWAEPDMAVLRVGRRPPPALPLDVFGREWAEWIGRAAEAAAAPPDYVAAPLLASASALIGNARWPEVAVTGWREPPHLWVGVVGDSGSSKSPGADCLMRDVLPEIERRMQGDFPDRHREWKALAETAKARQEVWEREVRQAQKKNTAPPDAPSGNDVPPEPQAPRLRQSDATVEKVALLLASAAPKGLLIVRDELAGWLLGMNAYNDAGRAFWIEAYGGRPYRVERVKHAEPIIVERLAVAVTGGTQPEKVSELFREADDGLLARICWIWPDQLQFEWGTKPPAADWATEALDRLRVLELAPGDDGAPAHPVLVPLTGEAVAMLGDFARAMQDRQQEAGGLMRSAFGKARGLALRLSLVLEFLWWSGKTGMAPPPGEVSHRALAAACALVDGYLIPMAERVYGDAAASTADRNAATLARWIDRHRPREVHVRHLQREVRLPGLAKAEAVHAAAEVLVDAGWLRPPGKGDYQARGKAAYAVNPALGAAP